MTGAITVGNVAARTEDGLHLNAGGNAACKAVLLPVLRTAAAH